MKLEKSTENTFVGWCEDLEIPAIKMNIGGRKGVWDRLLLLPYGEVWWVEFKRNEDEELSPLQIYFGEFLKRNGYAHSVVHSVAEARVIFEEVKWFVCTARLSEGRDPLRDQPTDGGVVPEARLRKDRRDAARIQASALERIRAALGHRWDATDHPSRVGQRSPKVGAGHKGGDSPRPTKGRGFTRRI